MRLQLQQDGGSYLTRVGDVRRHFKGGEVFECSDAEAAQLMAENENFVPYDQTIQPDTEPETAPDDAQATETDDSSEDEQSTTEPEKPAQSGAIGVADLSSGGRRKSTRKTAK